MREINGAWIMIGESHSLKIGWNTSPHYADCSISSRD